MPNPPKKGIPECRPAPSGISPHIPQNAQPSDAPQTPIDYRERAIAWARSVYIPPDTYDPKGLRESLIELANWCGDRVGYEPSPPLYRFNASNGKVMTGFLERVGININIHRKRISALGQLGLIENVAQGRGNRRRKTGFQLQTSWTRYRLKLPIFQESFQPDFNDAEARTKASSPMPENGSWPMPEKSSPMPEGGSPMPENESQAWANSVSGMGEVPLRHGPTQSSLLHVRSSKGEGSKDAAAADGLNVKHGELLRNDSTPPPARVLNSDQSPAQPAPFFNALEAALADAGFEGLSASYLSYHRWQLEAEFESSHRRGPAGEREIQHIVRRMKHVRPQWPDRFVLSLIKETLHTGFTGRPTEQEKPQPPPLTAEEIEAQNAEYARQLEERKKEEAEWEREQRAQRWAGLLTEINEWVHICGQSHARIDAESADNILSLLDEKTSPVFRVFERPTPICSIGPTLYFGCKSVRSATLLRTTDGIRLQAHLAQITGTEAKVEFVVTPEKWLKGDNYGA